MSGRKMIWKYLLKVLGAVFFIVLLGLLTASLILAKPQNDKTEIVSSRPFAEAGSTVTIDSEKDFVQLVSDFPAPVMNFMSGSGMVFVSAESAFVPVSDGFGKTLTLYWQTPEGQPVTLRNIWPGSALNLLENGFHFMPLAGPALFGSASVRMENDDLIRLHTTADQALYVVLLPRALNGQVNDLCRSLQRFLPPTLNTDEPNSIVKEE